MTRRAMKALEKLMAETVAAYEDMPHELQLRLVDEMRARGMDEDEIDHAIIRMEADVEERLELELAHLRARKMVH